MYNRRIFHWDHLNNLRQFIEILDHLHKSIDIDTIVSELRSTRHQWNKIKQKTKTLRRKFLEERAERMAEKMHTSAENALKAIIKAQESKYNFSSIRSLTGKMNSSQAQVDVLADPNDPNSPKTTLTSKDEVEQAILHRNQIHSRQSLATPVAANPSLASAVHPF
jgi:predicted GTPase